MNEDGELERSASTHWTDERAAARTRPATRRTDRLITLVVVAGAIVSITLAAGPMARPPGHGTSGVADLAGKTWYIVGDRSRVGGRTFPADFTATLRVEAGTATFTLPCGTVLLSVAIADGQLHFSSAAPGKLPGKCSVPADIGLSLGELITRYFSDGVFTMRQDGAVLTLTGNNGQGLALSTDH